MFLFSELIAPACAVISFILVIAAQSVCDFYQISNLYINTTDLLEGVLDDIFPNIDPNNVTDAIPLPNITLKNGIWRGFEINFADPDFLPGFGGCHEYTDESIISTTSAQKAGMAFSILTLISLVVGLAGMGMNQKALAMVGVVLALLFNMLMFVVFEDCNSKESLDENIFDLKYVSGSCAPGSGSIITIVSVVLLVVSLSTTYQCCCLPVEGQATPGGEAAAGTEVKEEAETNDKEEDDKE